MDVLSKAMSLRAWRFCARVTVAFCLVVFGLGDAVDRSFAAHVTLGAALTYAVSADASADLSADHSGVHMDGQSGHGDASGQPVGHGCHACAALPEPIRRLADAPPVRGSTLAWALAPSAAGREPLIDLRPPRA